VFFSQHLGSPYAAAQVISFNLPAYAEQTLAGAGTFALNYAAQSTTSTRTELGLRSDKSLAIQDGIFTLRGRAAWAHDYNNDRAVTAVFQTLPGASFVVNGARPNPDGALVSAGAEMKWINGSRSRPPSRANSPAAPPATPARVLHVIHGDPPIDMRLLVPLFGTKGTRHPVQRMLADLSHFVIVDNTNPRSTPLEPQATVLDYLVPFVPILEKGQAPFSIFVDLKNKYDWVLDPVIVYLSVDRLIEVLEGKIIGPAHAKFNQFLARQTKQLRVENV
jgi:Autotransporter beta-domain